MPQLRLGVCRLCAYCALGGIVAFVGLTLLLVAPGAWHMLGATLGQGQRPPRVQYAANADSPHVFPLAPASFPEAFQGAIWMDQAGFYGHSDLPFAAPDLGISFGDQSFSTYDPDTRTLAVDVAGPSWIWQNNWLGYAFFAFVKFTHFHYLFELSKDATVIQVYPCLDVGRLGKLCIPRVAMNFTMEKIPSAPKTVCPPRPGTAKEDVIKCAKWDRVTTTWLTPLLGKRGVAHYYAYQIVDGAGRPVQPYYHVYQSFANSTCRPNRQMANLLDVAAPRMAECPTYFRGLPASGVQGPPGGQSTEL